MCQKFRMIGLVVFVVAAVFVLNARKCQAKPFFPDNLPQSQWVDFSAEGFEKPVTGVIYNKDSHLDCGMPLGGIDTGCMDIEPSGLLGYSTIFNDLVPRGGPVNTAILGLNISGKTWVMTTGKTKTYCPYNKGPVNLTPAMESPRIDFDQPGVEKADDILYWGHYPIVDMQFQTKAPVDVSMRAWAPFVPGDVAVSNMPGAVFKVKLKNNTKKKQEGTLAFNFPGFEGHRSLIYDPDSGRQEVVFKQDQAPFDGSVFTERNPNVGKNALAGGEGSRMLIADPSGDGRNELIVPLKDKKTGRGFLVSFQRTAECYGKVMDGTGEYEYEIIDILPKTGIIVAIMGDIDGDGKDELVAGAENGLIYAYKRKRPGFLTGNIIARKGYERLTLNEPPKAPTYITDVATGDIDADGKDDVFYVKAHGPGADPAPGAYMIKDGKVSSVVTDPQAHFTACTLGDFNGDGKLELAVGSTGGANVEQNGVKIYYFADDATVTAVEVAHQAPLEKGPAWITAGDFEGYGQDSLIISDAAKGTYWKFRNNVPVGTENAWSEPVSFNNRAMPALSYATYAADKNSTKKSIFLGSTEKWWTFNSLKYTLDTNAKADDASKPEGWNPDSENYGQEIGELIVADKPKAPDSSKRKAGVWKAKPWGSPGSNAHVACAIGDLSGDGESDIIFWGNTISAQLSDRVISGRSLRSLSPSLPDNKLNRKDLPKPFKGVTVGESIHNRSYTVAVDTKQKVRFGADLGFDAETWAQMHKKLPNESDSAGTCAAIDFKLKPGETQEVHFVLSWFAPEWKGGGVQDSLGNSFTHMYASRYKDSVEISKILLNDHKNLLDRILAWQQVIYDDENIPGWLSDGLVNIFHLITEDSVWGQAKAPIGDWCRPEDGLFGMNECPRGCSQIECIPCSFYGNMPLVYFFPETAISTLRAYKGYLFPEGRPSWVFGGCTAWTPACDIAVPSRGYQTVLNGACYVIMADRYWKRTGDKEMLREFWDSLKRCTDWSFSLRPEYGPSQVLAMPTGNADAEWFEAPEPGWKGYFTHGGGVRLAQAAVMREMAVTMDDREYLAKCDAWIEASQKALEEHLWAGNCYYNFHEPETGEKSDFVFGYQLDGEWIADYQGVQGIFPKNRIDTTLETIKNINCQISSTGAVNYANTDGSPAQVGGYGTYSYFPPELLMLAMNYMYEGQQEFGMFLAKRCWENITCSKGYTWDAPNIMQGDANEGHRRWGWDYYQNMMLWSLPAAINGQDLTGPCRKGGLVQRVIEAGNR